MTVGRSTARAGPVDRRGGARRPLVARAPAASRWARVAIVPNGASPLQSIPAPSVAANVSYVDGVTGGNVFVVTRLGARRLAAAMMGMEPPAEDDGSDLDEIELSAVGEAMNQSMAAAAGATGKVLGQEVEISVPETRVLAARRRRGGRLPARPRTRRPRPSSCSERRAG